MKNLTKSIIALFSFIIFANFFFFREPTPLSFGLFFLGLGIYIMTVAEHHHKAMKILILVSFYTIVILWIRATNFIQLQAVLSLIALTAIIWYMSLSQQETFESFTAVFLSPFFAGLTYMKRFFSFIKPATFHEGYKKSIELLSDRQTHTRSISTLIGFAIALPIMIVLVSMFASADPIYYSYLKQIVSSDFLAELPWRIILSIVLVGGLIPLFYPKSRRIFFSPGALLSRVQITHELSIVMGVVALVIASFIVIQWPYVFANVKAEVDLSQFGVATYAEYVKKGFIELLRVSAFIYALLWLGLTSLRRDQIKSKMLSLFQWIVLGEFMIILISIARRVYLYQMYHGLTLIRVYGSFFLLWLTCMALTLAGRHLNNKVRFGLIEGGITLILFMSISAWNAEQYIVRVHPPTVNKRIDYVYLSRMSADGVEGWLQAYLHAKGVIQSYTNMSGELDANARREIAYASYIIRRLTYKQYEYMNAYASPTEMHEYIISLVDFQKNRLDKERADLIKYQIMRPPNEDWTKSRIAEITQLQNNLEKLKSQSLTIPLPLKEQGEGYTDVSIGQWQEVQSFDAYLTPRLLSFYDSYNSSTAYYQNIDEVRTVVDRYVKRTAFDRLYAQNVSDKNAYIIMKKNLPLDQLHTLQAQYFELYTRIGKQSVRDFERDISLNSPLL